MSKKHVNSQIETGLVKGSSGSTSVWLITSLALSMLMPSMDTSIANAGLPRLADAFGATFHEVQWVVLAYLLAVTSLIVSVGKLGDILGRRKLLLTGIAVFTISSLLCAVSPTLSFLVLARALQGLGAAMMMALTVALVAGSISKEKTGSAIGILGTMSAIGTAIGPSVGGLLISRYGWPMIFMINIPIGVANFVLVLRNLPVDSRSVLSERPRFDIAGTLLLTTALCTYALAMTIEIENSWELKPVLIGIAAAAGIGFIYIESRVASPLVDLRIFREPVLSAGLVSTSIVSAVMMSTLIVGPFYLSTSLGLGPVDAGMALSVGPLVAAAAGIPAGRIVDRFGARTMTIAGLAGIAMGTVLVVITASGGGVLGYVAPIALTTASYALFQAGNNTIIMAGASPQRRGVISGMLSLSRNLGLISGTAVMGAIFSLATGTSEMSTAGADTVGFGMRVTFTACALLVGVALTVVLVSRVVERQTLNTKQKTAAI